MNNLADEIILNIASYFELIELYNFKNSSSLLNKKFIKKFNEKFVINRNLIKKNYSKLLISLFGGENIMAFFPTLKWKDKYCGSTGYIDRISCKNVNYPIMIGIDDADRSFITIYTHNKDSEFGKDNVTTIFQRYTNDKYTWTHGTSGYSFISESQYIISRNNLQHQLIRDNLKNLITKKNYVTMNGYKKNYEIDLSLNYSYCFNKK